MTRKTLFMFGAMMIAGSLLFSQGPELYRYLNMRRM